MGHDKMALEIVQTLAFMGIARVEDLVAKCENIQVHGAGPVPERFDSPDLRFDVFQQ